MVQLFGNVVHVVLAYFLLKHSALAPGTALGLAGGVTYIIFFIGFHTLRGLGVAVTFFGVCVFPEIGGAARIFSWF